LMKPGKGQEHGEEEADFETAVAGHG
jgi:hypothetical protein